MIQPLFALFLSDLLWRQKTERHLVGGVDDRANSPLLLEPLSNVERLMPVRHRELSDTPCSDLYSQRCATNFLSRISLDPPFTAA